MKSFKELAISFLRGKGFSPLECDSEQEARHIAKNQNNLKQWPCYFSESETTGEKLFEEFYSEEEKINLIKYENIGVIENEHIINFSKIIEFKKMLLDYRKKMIWKRKHILEFFKNTLIEFNHIEKDKFLDEKM